MSKTTPHPLFTPSLLIKLFTFPRMFFLTSPCLLLTPTFDCETLTDRRIFRDFDMRIQTIGTILASAGLLEMGTGGSVVWRRGVRDRTGEGGECTSGSKETRTDGESVWVVDVGTSGSSIAAACRKR